jgi:hypothetical protein
MVIAAKAQFGATWGDAAIHLIDFAQAKPGVFLEVVVPLGIVAIVVLVLVYRIFVVGPLAGLKNQFDAVRQGGAGTETQGAEK